MVIRYKRVVLKISGEGLCRAGGDGIDVEEIRNISEQIVDVVKTGAQVAVVVGGGNFLRGEVLSADGGVQRATADYMGMLATIINALALQDVLEHLGQPTRVTSALTMVQICEPFIRKKVISDLERGRVVILAAGVGSPFFTTDTCAALRAAEIQADILLKATKVDKVCDSDPVENPNARAYDRLTYRQIIDENLRIMDMTAVSMAMETGIPILVFNLKKKGNIARAVAGEPIGTLITAEPSARNSGRTAKRANGSKAHAAR